jgi:hypothetical protein
MRASCNFLPPEHRAFLLDRRILAVSGLLFAVSFCAWGSVIATRTRGLTELRAAISGLEREQAAVAEQRAGLKYPEQKIQHLVEQFKFVQKAAGGEDFPWLRFYQAIEAAVPTDDEGGRLVYIAHLDRLNSKSWIMEGHAKDWKHATAFEEKLSASSSGGASPRRQFASVHLVNSRTAPTARGYHFQLQFDFEP